MKYFADYNIMSPDDFNDFIFNGFDRSLSVRTRERLMRQFENYDYYNGKQHRDEMGRLVKAKDLKRPSGVDYDPTRYATNYFKAIVDRKARWQMGGHHGIKVKPKQIDDIDDVFKDGYEPSDEQKRENKRAEGFEKLLYQLWDENRMRARLVQAARDRLIADRVVCKIVYNDRTGKLRWIFRPDTEYIPIYSDDDFEELITANFVKGCSYESDGEIVPAIRKQTFTMENGRSFVHEAIYRESDLKLLETIQDKTNLGLDFIPVQEFPVNELLSENIGDSEISALREQNDILNQMNEDAIDSLKFEMFEITAITNATPGTADEFIKAPGAVAEISSSGDKNADIKTVSGNFGWKEAFKDQYNRVKSAMHEISGLPQIVPQELNFGGLNGDALHVLFHDIITDTEEHWISWGYNLSELHKKSIKYLQARVNRHNFSYDRRVVRDIGTDYDNEIKFQLPLPDNRKELVELLEMETISGFESKKGAMERLGVEDIKAKMQEIESEKNRKKERSVASYGESAEEIDAGGD